MTEPADTRPEKTIADGPTAPAVTTDHEPPSPATRDGVWTGSDGTEVAYRARGEWILLREKDQPVAEMFSVSYVAIDGDAAGATRPVTFVFNGGPGASSAYLHVGALGPTRVAFNPDGTTLSPPVRLVPNNESWLAFTDLVFIDPIGTGFSRIIDPDTKSGGGGRDDKAAEAPGGAAKDKRFFAVQRDLESIGEFIRRWLSTYNRWGSPVAIAGESYGGYRVGRLAKLLPETYGIGLNAAILISPALEIDLLDSSDYNVLPWIDRAPTMALSAAFHGKSRAFSDGAEVSEIVSAAENFATGEYASFLTRGASVPAEDRERILSTLADLIGFSVESVEEVERRDGRVDLVPYIRTLLADQRKVVGAYDTTITATNPFPDRDGFTWPDPTLVGIEATFAAGINHHLRGWLGVRTDREYVLLSLDVNRSWTHDYQREWAQSAAGATDDLRYGMSLNPHLRVFVTHGRYDLVTPYYAADRMVNLMRLTESDRDRITPAHFGGGHMFYAWEDSRVAFREAVGTFFRSAVGSG